MGEEEEEKLLDAFRELLREVRSPNHLPAASPPPPSRSSTSRHSPPSNCPGTPPLARVLTPLITGRQVIEMRSDGKYDADLMGRYNEAMVQLNEEYLRMVAGCFMQIYVDEARSRQM